MSASADDTGQVQHDDERDQSHNPGHDHQGQPIGYARRWGVLVLARMAG
jgi:hypothetical protein